MSCHLERHTHAHTYAQHDVTNTHQSLINVLVQPVLSIAAALAECSLFELNYGLFAASCTLARCEHNNHSHVQ